MPRRIALFVAALALAACSKDDNGRPTSSGAGVASEPPDIVLVVVDTLRADHLGCYGYYRDTSPHIDALASEGILFERAISPIATTLPAHVSLLTGLYPHQHGFVANAGAIKARFSSRPGRRSVATLLREAGYTTAAFVSGPTISSKTGIEDGFDFFDEHQVTDTDDLLDHSRRAEATTAKALEWLATDPPRPFFLLVHYWDPHEPNAPLAPYESMFKPDERLDELIEERRIHPAELRERFNDLELARLFAPELARDLMARREVEMPAIDQDALRRLLSQYDGDVRNVDERVGELIATLRARGRWEESIFVFTSDHGQALGQHDWLEHGRIELPNTHVPLIFRLPAGLAPQPARIGRVVSLLDVMPTVLARVGGPAAAELARQAEGQDLLSDSFERPYAFSQRSARERAWSPDPADNGPEFALTLDEWRYFHLPLGSDRLYHLPTDPGELHNVIAEQPELVRKFERIVRDVLARRPYRPGDEVPGDTSDELFDLLKKLGYTGED